MEQMFVRMELCCNITGIKVNYQNKWDQTVTGLVS